MRFAVVSEIQGNLTALRAVLAALETDPEPVDRIICAGDVVGLGPQPNEVIDLLRERAVEAVRGNYDDAVAFERVGSGVDFVDRESEQVDRLAVAWTRRTLTPENLTWLRELPRDLRLFPGGGSSVAVKRDDLQQQTRDYGRGLWAQAIFGSLVRSRPKRIKKVLVLHGTPRALNEYVWPDAADSILSAITRDAKADLLISGHAGLAFQRSTTDTMFVGAGSLSGPHATPGYAEYAIVNWRGDIDVEFARVQYDPSEHARNMLSRGMPAALASRFSSHVP